MKNVNLNLFWAYSLYRVAVMISLLPALVLSTTSLLNKLNYGYHLPLHYLAIALLPGLLLFIKIKASISEECCVIQWCLWHLPIITSRRHSQKNDFFYWEKSKKCWQLHLKSSCEGMPILADSERHVV